MTGTDVVARSVNEMSLAAWFGGSLMGAVGLERAAAQARERRIEVESAGWSAWQPLQMAAMAAQIGSGIALTLANRKRLVGQRGVGSASMVRAAATAAALGATFLAARTGAEMAHTSQNGNTSGSGDERSGRGDDAGHRAAAVPDDRLERRIRTLQWAVPALTGAMVVLDAIMGEQQRPTKVAKGVSHRLVPDAMRDNVRELGARVMEMPERLLDKVS
jgi:hypothetical protein